MGPNATDFLTAFNLGISSAFGESAAAMAGGVVEATVDPPYDECIVGVQQSCQCSAEQCATIDVEDPNSGNGRNLHGFYVAESVPRALQTKVNQDTIGNTAAVYYSCTCHCILVKLAPLTHSPTDAPTEKPTKKPTKEPTPVPTPDITSAPTPATLQPVETPAPVPVTSAPVDVTPAPVDVTPAPVDVTSAPVETPAPVVPDTPAPVDIIISPTGPPSNTTRFLVWDGENMIVDEVGSSGSSIENKNLNEEMTVTMNMNE